MAHRLFDLPFPGSVSGIAGERITISIMAGVTAPAGTPLTGEATPGRQ
jgi:hypothetical protein